GMGAGIAWMSIRPKRFRALAKPSIYRMPYESVRLHSSDGAPLAGWFIPASEKLKSNPKGVIVLCHGVDSEKTGMLAVAQTPRNHGYSTLLFDFRARGESGGRCCTLGYREVDDLLAAISYVRSRPDSKKLPIGVLGESLGGSTALMGTARCKDVR